MVAEKLNKPPSSRLRRIIIDFFIIIGVSIGLIILAEAVLRLFFPQDLQGERIIGKTFSEPDDVLGLRYSPGAKWRFTHPEYEAEYAINDHGFRDTKAHPVPKPPGTVRVLLVGDSFTFGQGVNYHESWPAMVERRLHESGYDHIDLVKAGMQGMDTRSEFLLMQRLLEQYQYDVIVVGFLINDLYSNTLYGLEDSQEVSTDTADKSISDEKDKTAESWLKHAKRIFIRNDRQTTFHLLDFAKRLAISLDSAYCKLYLSSPNNADYLTIPLKSEPKKKLEITQTLFEKISNFSDASGIKLVVLSIPQQFQVLCFKKTLHMSNIEVYFHDVYFSDFAKRRNFTWITTLDDFIESKYDKDELFFRLDGHLTPAGNQIVAKAFLNEVIPHLQTLE